MSRSDPSRDQKYPIRQPVSFVERLRIRASAWLYKILLQYKPKSLDLSAHLGNIQLQYDNPIPAKASVDSRLSRQGDTAEQPNCQDIDGINRLVNAKHGLFLANRFDHYLGGALIRYGEYGELEHTFLRSFIRPGDGVVEIGSNIGTHTIGLAKAVGSNGIVVAIEPQPAIFRVLCANLALNSVLNVKPFACGCGYRKETMNVPEVDYGAAITHNSGGISLTSTGTGSPVSVVPLDDLLEDVPRLRLIKVDVEGMEREVLLGANRIIGKYRPLLYVENDRIDKSKALIEWIMAAGYRLWWHTPPLFNPNNHFCTEENIYKNVVSFNMLCQSRDAGVLISTDGLTEITDPSYHPLRR